MENVMLLHSIKSTNPLTVTIMQWLSLIAPQHPKNAMTKIILPTTISAIAAPSIWWTWSAVLSSREPRLVSTMIPGISSTSPHSCKKKYSIFKNMNKPRFNNLEWWVLSFNSNYHNFLSVSRLFASGVENHYAMVQMTLVSLLLHMNGNVIALNENVSVGFNIVLRELREL